MPNQEDEREDIANIASTLVGLASFTSRHGSTHTPAVAGSTAVETKPSVSAKSTSTSTGTGKVGALHAKIEKQPRRKLPFGSKASKSSNDAKERKSPSLPKMSGAVTPPPKSPQLGSPAPANKESSLAPDQANIPSVKGLNGGGKEVEPNKPSKNRSPQIGKAVTVPPTNTAVPAVDASSKQFPWSVASHMATTGVLRGSSTEPPTKKMRTGGNKASTQTLSDDKKAIKGVSPTILTNGYKPEISMPPYFDKAKMPGSEFAPFKNLPLLNGHSYIAPGVANNQGNKPKKNTKEPKRKLSKLQEAASLADRMKSLPVGGISDQNSKYIMEDFASKIDQRTGLPNPPTTFIPNFDPNFLQSKVKITKKSAKGKKASPSVPFASQMMPGSYLNNESNMKGPAKDTINTGIPKEKPFVSTMASSAPPTNNYPSANLAYPQSVTLQNVRDSAAQLKLFQELQQANQPRSKAGPASNDRKMDFSGSSSNMYTGATPHLPTPSSADVSFASGGDKSSLTSNQSLLAKILNGNSGLNPDQDTQELALKLLKQHYQYGAVSTKEDSNNKSDKTGDLSGSDKVPVQANDNPNQELQNQLLLMSQLRSINANDRFSGLPSIDNSIAAPNSSMSLLSHPLASQLLLSQFGLGNNDLNQRSLNHGTLQQLLQLQQLQNLQQLLQPAEYQADLGDRRKHQQALQQQLQQPNAFQSSPQATFPPAQGSVAGEGNNVFTTLLAQALMQQQQQAGNFQNRPTQPSNLAAQAGAMAAGESNLARNSLAGASRPLQQQSQLWQQQQQIPLHILAALMQNQN